MAEKRKVLLRLENIKMHFPLKKSSIFQRERKIVKAVDGITIDIYEGETLGLVGESGCGKSTLGRVILQLYNQTGGSMLYRAVTLDDYAPRYVKRIIQTITGINTTDSKTILTRYPECVKLAGGMLISGKNRKVAELLMDKFRAVAAVNKLEAETRVVQLKYDALAETPDISEIERKKLEQYREKLSYYRDKLAGAREIAASRNTVLEAFKDGFRDRAGFDELEAGFDHSVDLSQLSKEEMRVLRRDLQMVFQDPYSSLNPRLTVGQLIAEALVAHSMFKRGTKQMERYTLDIMDKCGLQNYMLHRYPHQFSGGQRQRIGIARSLALKPKFVVCDEAVSALDVSIQSQIINLFADLKEQENLTYLFISHDLSAVKFISDRIGVMYLGNIIELGGADIIFSESLHPYTEALLDAIPTTEDESNKELQIIEGDIPSPIDPPPGCKFHTRCKYATDKCRIDVPEWREWRPGHYVACHYPLREGSLRKE